MSVTAQPARALIDRPVFLVSSPRSGSTLLFETLAWAPDLFTTGDESHLLIESMPQLIPALRGWDSNRLTRADASQHVIDQLASAFYARLRDRTGRGAAGTVRMLEKTPKNALRVSFFDAIWPEALFVYLYRDPRQTLASMMRAWQSGRFRTYPRLPDWEGLPWSLLLVPGWRGLIGKPLAEIVARQWAITTSILLDDLQQLRADRVVAIDYDAFLADAQRETKRVLTEVGVNWDVELPAELPPSRMTLTAPNAGKWRELETDIEGVWPIVADVDERARAFFSACTGETLANPPSQGGK